MSAPVLALILIAADPALIVGLRVEEAQGVSSDELRVLVRDLKRAIEQEQNAAVAVDDALWAECGTPGGCVAEIRARTNAQEIVLLKAFGASTRIRLVAERVDGVAGPARTLQADFPRAPALWPSMASGMARMLFPSSTSAAHSPPVQALETPPAPARSTLPAWIAFGGGAVSAGVAIALRVSSNAARDRVASSALAPEELDRTRSRSSTEGLISNLLFGLAAAAIAAGTVYSVDQ